MAIKIADLFAGLRVKVDNSSIKAADKAIGDLKYALAGLGVYAAARWIKNIVQDTIDLAGQLADTAQEIGVNAEALQQLGYAAQLSGSSLGGMTAALKILQRNAFAASKGGKQQAKAFSDMGVKIKEADGSLRPAEDLLGDIADHIASLPDGTAKTGAAMKVFGRSGASLIPLLNEGSAGIAKMRQEFVDLGGQISEENVNALEAFGDEQDKVKVAFAGLRNTIAIELLPTLVELTESFLEWFKANQDWIRSGLRTAVDALAIAMKALALAFRIVFRIFKWIVDHGTLLTVIILSIAGAFAVLRVQAFLAMLMSGKSIGMLLAGWRLMASLAWAAAQMSIRAALASARAWIIANAPLILITATIALIILVIEDLYYWITGGESLFKDWWKAIGGWKGVWEGAKKGFQAFSDFVLDGLGSIGESIADLAFDFANMYSSDRNKKELRKEGKLRGLKGEELDKFVEHGVSNQIAGNAAGVNTGPILGRAGEAAFDRTTLGRMFYSGKQQQNVTAGATLQPVFNITLPPGSDPKDFATAAKTSFDGYWNDQLRRAKAGAGK